MVYKNVVLEHHFSVSVSETFPCHSFGSVWEAPEAIYPGAEYQGAEGVDEPDEEDHPDRRGTGRAVRAVEGAERD